MNKNHRYKVTKWSWQAGSHYTYEAVEWTLVCACGWETKTREYGKWIKPYNHHLLDVLLDLAEISRGESL